ncbi:TVP38/TMEM64 family protein [Aestuariispira insulae]|uniref:TVP38/TMEM64 family membrane protein n=1 Tax=Aestuariispira insulae TaxID=1461337 RepID=A0A3D9H6C2_9PROT|nr:TVP38/TMEM64 family protein [Aestuariispira insulae]RED45034.1 putative membrane protein YdjX (TVP38/TMEM64 family) [Aestuariispira insulae]
MTEVELEMQEKKSIHKRLLPVYLLIAVFILFIATGLHEHFTPESLKENHATLTSFVQENALLAALAFIILYALCTLFSLPIATVITLAGGFMFGAVLGTAYTVMGATIGATALFLVAKTSLGELLHEKAGPWLDKLEKGFHENELSYLFFLRLVPLFPFVAVNLAPAFLGVSVRNYVIATFFGIIPGSAAYNYVGAGLGSILEQGGEISLEGVLTPEILTGIILLCGIALLPVVYKKIKGTQAED